ncbi:MAG: SDR family oxidoreductase [Victivallaceae bacterium]|nr:SDR family oxidoreductase [Victivallaceae bacterium]
MNNLFDISGKVAVVTGAGGVLAGTVAKYLAEQGCHVAALDLRESAVTGLGSGITGFGCNVLDEENLADVCSAVLEKFGRVDMLFNGAGGNMPGATIGPDQTLYDIKLEDYSKVLDLNLKGTLLPTLVFSKPMTRQVSGGAIVNFSSMAATQPLTRVMGYGNAKAGIDNLTRFLAVELAVKFGAKIRVNAIAPGFFVTNQNRALLTTPDGGYTERGNDVIRKTPLRRFGVPEEILGCIHYLVSDAAKFVTGTIIPVDGGFSAFSGV